ncbi:hypothetical protein BGZ99_004675 [Dissophora globulifera]|uniref:Phospholipid/glycerol acyltransferase domain-containing protein n=1 Tax=Dissophora globulifera TaxID=979702 RepID=A0A9P6UUH4_9FUNG|nr:hypothetical protein BGZ99_004675 [Dissophora globulifera]
MARRKIPGLYSFVKLLCRTLFHIFFRDYDALHASLVPDNEPLLVVSNHGNYLLDGLALLATYPGQISFLMAQPNFDTAIGGIARKIGAIPVQRPQDATKYDGTSQVTIAPDGSTIVGDNLGTQLSVGDTVYVECGSFQDAGKDNRVTQCYGVVAAIINDNQVSFKAPGLTWIPPSLTSERDIAYIKSRKIVRYGSLKIRVERGNTWVGINDALKTQQQQNGVAASSAAGNIGKFFHNMFTGLTDPDVEAVALARSLEQGIYTGADIPGSVTAPPNFHTSETTPLLRKTPSRPLYAAVRHVNSTGGLSSISTAYSSNEVDAVDTEDESDELHRGNGYAALTDYSGVGNGSAMEGSSKSTGPPNAISYPTAASPAAHFPTVPCPFQYSRPIDHSVIYESVWKNFEDRRTVAVFPEGVSSDDYHLLDFKYGCTIMVLGYLAQHPSKTLRIIPCGLNFFNRHRFRSRFYADYGVPITVPENLVSMYREGGDAKKQACTELLQIIHAAVEGLTLNAPNYDELRLYKATRRLYSTGMKLTVPKKLELTRRFAKGYLNLTKTPATEALKRDINAFDKHLSNHGVRDWQLTANPRLFTAVVLILPALLLLPPLFLLSLPGTLLFGPVGLLATWVAKRKGAEAMKAFQSYLPVSRWPGRDVIATWKIIVCLALMPVCFILDATLLTVGIYQWGIFQDYWTTGRLIAFWLISTCVIFPTIAYWTVWIWEWQIDLKMQINVWWWRISGSNAEMKRWRQDLVGKVDDLVVKMGGRTAFVVSGDS